MRTIELGVTITDAAVDDERTTIFCAPVPVIPAVPTAAGMENIVTPWSVC